MTAVRQIMMICGLCVLMMLASAPAASAACSVNSAGLSVTPVAANTGTYTPPTVPAAQTQAIVVSGTLRVTGGGGTCRVGMAFHRTSLPATMARSGGGATLAYGITTSGGTSLLYTGGGNPSTSNMYIAQGTIFGSYTALPFTATFPVQFAMSPVDPQRAGSYSDGPTLHIFSIGNGNNVTDVGSFGFTVTGTVSSVCTIGGVSNPTADSAAIPVSSAGVVSTAAINKAYANVSCNSLTNVVATSLNGGLKGSAAAASGFTDIIDYSVAATFGGATSNLNTSSVATAAGTETGSTATTSSATPSGSLSVSITPISASQPLAAGSYSDTLRITVTAQ